MAAMIGAVRVSNSYAQAYPSFGDSSSRARGTVDRSEFQLAGEFRRDRCPSDIWTARFGSGGDGRSATLTDEDRVGSLRSAADDRRSGEDGALRLSGVCHLMGDRGLPARDCSTAQPPPRPSPGPPWRHYRTSWHQVRMIDRLGKGPT